MSFKLHQMLRTLKYTSKEKEKNPTNKKIGIM